MAGTLVVDTIQSGASLTPPTITDSAGTQIGTLCRAWVNFGYVASAVTVRQSFNVSSITRAGAGQFLITFTNAMPDANYAVSGIGSAANTATAAAVASIQATNGTSAPTVMSTTQIQITFPTSGTAQDVYTAGILIFR